MSVLSFPFGFTGSGGITPKPDADARDNDNFEKQHIITVHLSFPLALECGVHCVKHIAPYSWNASSIMNRTKQKKKHRARDTITRSPDDRPVATAHPHPDSTLMTLSHCTSHPLAPP